MKKIAFAVLLPLGALLCASGSGPKHPSPAALESRVSDLENQIAALQKQVATLEQEVHSLQRQPRIFFTPPQSIPTPAPNQPLAHPPSGARRAPPLASPWLLQIPPNWQEREFNGLKYYFEPLEGALGGSR